jgi:hypothetical protein
MTRPTIRGSVTFRSEELRSGEREGVSMGFRRRSRRRGLIAGAAIVHHRDRRNAEQEQPADQAPADQAPADYAPPPVDPADEIEHLAQLHASGALTDEEFTAAKAHALGT